MWVSGGRYIVRKGALDEIRVMVKSVSMCMCLLFFFLLFAALYDKHDACDRQPFSLARSL